MDKKDYHPRIDHREPPDSLVALRNELQKPEHKEIHDYAIKGRTFEECLGMIAAKLDVVLDGMYDPAELCDMLLWELRRKTHPWLAPYKKLVRAEIVETKDEILLEAETAPTLIPGDLQSISKEQLDEATQEPVQLLGEDGLPIPPTLH